MIRYHSTLPYLGWVIDPWVMEWLDMQEVYNEIITVHIYFEYIYNKGLATDSKQMAHYPFNFHQKRKK